MSQFVTSTLSISFPPPPNALSTGVSGPVKNQTNLSMSSYLPNLYSSTTKGSIGVPSTLYGNPSLPYILPMAPQANNSMLCWPFTSTFLFSTQSSSVGFPASATVQATNLNNSNVFPQFSQ